VNALLDRLLDGQHLDEDEADALLVTLAGDDVSPLMSSAVLAALRAKGETPAEVRGLARALRRLARKPAIPRVGTLVDVVGTGGDGSRSYNLSTGTALLSAACGHRVVKHGNRSVSSRSGSADVLAALGLPLPLGPVDAARCLDASGFTFLFAPAYHPAMKAVADVRRALGVRTVFNILGPLVNPVEPTHMLIGAYAPGAARLIADALAGLPIERAFVVHGEPGWDEATPCGPFLLYDVRPGHVDEQVREPESYGLSRCAPAALAGGDAEGNARALERVFGGERGAHRDALVLGAALVGELTGATPEPRRAAERAAVAIDEGRAATLLATLGDFGQEVSRAS
jgi:anthranilate phosphoribosyltransferase